MKKKLFTSLLLFYFVANTFSQNLITNGNFEDYFNQWENVVSDGAAGEFSIDTLNAQEGNNAMKVEISTLGTNEWSVQSMHDSWPSVTGVEYKMTLYAKADANETKVRAIQQLNNYAAQDFSLTTSWQKYEWIFIASEDNLQLKFHFYDTGVIYIDNITIEENIINYSSDNESTINTDTRFQTMEGFGGALAFYESWVTSHPNKEQLYKLLYEDLEINMIRLRNAYRYETDFSSKNTELVQKANELSTKPLKILLTSWSPPADLKSNGSLNNGTLAKVNGEFVYQDFANYWKASLEAYAKIGVEPNWIGIQNEPDFQTDDWETCKFKPSETDEFPGYDTALDYVYNSLKSMDNIPLFIGAEELGIGYNNFNNYSQPIQSKSYLWAYGYHLYHGGDPESPDSFNSDFTNIAQNYNNKPNIMTEYEHFDSGWFKTAWLMCNNLSYGNCAGYFYWNLIWPDSGLIGIDNPWDEASWSNSVGYTVNPHFYAFKHFSKYIKPGYQRVECINTNDGIRSSVFISPDKEQLIVVLLNIADKTITTNVTPSGFQESSTQVFQSVEDNYYQSLGSVTATGILSLPSKSITTIVFGDIQQQEYPDSITLSSTSLTLEVGSETYVSAHISPTNITNDSITWASSATEIATVDTNGLIKAQSIGSTTITATTANNLSASCTITVITELANQAPTAVISADTVNTSTGSTITFSANKSSDPDGDELTYTWDFGDGSIDEGISTTHAYADTGNYTVTLTVSDGIDADVVSISVTVSNNSNLCDNPTSITLPYSQDGEGKYCLITSNDIAIVNSWNMSLVTINGIDYTNIWSDILPAKIEGNYYIYYDAPYGWSHIEISAIKSATINDSSNIINHDNIKLFPNPFNQYTNLVMEGETGISQIQIYTLDGKEISHITPDKSLNNIKIGSELDKGLYIVTVTLKNETKTFLIKKH